VRDGPKPISAARTAPSTAASHTASQLGWSWQHQLGLTLRKPDAILLSSVRFVGLAGAAAAREWPGGVTSGACARGAHQWLVRPPGRRVPTYPVQAEDGNEPNDNNDAGCHRRCRHPRPDSSRGCFGPPRPPARGPRVPDDPEWLPIAAGVDGRSRPARAHRSRGDRNVRRGADPAALVLSRLRCADGSATQARVLEGRGRVRLVERADRACRTSVPGGTISSTRSRMSSLSITSRPASRSPSCSVMRTPRSALDTPGWVAANAITRFGATLRIQEAPSCCAAGTGSCSGDLVVGAGPATTGTATATACSAHPAGPAQAPPTADKPYVRC